MKIKIDNVWDGSTSLGPITVDTSNIKAIRRGSTEIHFVESVNGIDKIEVYGLFDVVTLLAALVDATGEERNSILKNLTKVASHISALDHAIDLVTEAEKIAVGGA